MEAVDSEKATAAEKFLAHVTRRTNFSWPMRKMKVLEVRSKPYGYVKAELVIEKEHCNARNVLHGGMVSLLVDVVGVMAWIAKDGRAAIGPSIEFSTSFERSAELGETIVIEAKCTKSGRSLGFTGTDIYRKGDGLLVASGRHTLVRSKV
ncbi:acyl-coenzyme A thioesterase 13-like [Sycon ciliatum]|uniref:acyl-coenzyme A thioesterase 13-like n=1 Tax=Sycon ciliatum TaxID=27933 RepID=UPI0031F652EE|eukprot:scpid20245/ scgid27865/ Acyl-coenzyme A thioesterase 13; Thioesterase superfamily member 2 &gt; Acyl-coenzyme A thioesterase 13; Thioesterase superfamily member 2